MAQDEVDTTGWMTARDAARAMGGISLATLTRMAQNGEVERERGDDGKWLYDPSTFPRAGEGPIAQVHPPVDPQAVMLQGGAEMVRVSSAALQQMVGRILESQAATLAALKDNAQIHQQLFEQMAKRCETLEASHTQMILAREKMLDRSAEREAVTRELDRSGELKAKGIKLLAEQGPAILELILAYNRKDEACPEEEPPAIVEQPEQSSDSSESESSSGSD